MKKWLLYGGGGVVALIIVGVVVMYFIAGDVIKAAVEKYGSEVTQAKVTLDKVDLSLTSGKGSLSGLVVGNPKGFKTPSAMRLGQVSVTIDTGTITNDTVVIKEVLIMAPEVTYELGDGGSNIDALKRNADAYAKARGFSGSTKKEKPEAAKPEEAKEAKKLIIENLIVRSGKVSVSAPFLQGKALGTSLPSIHLKDIGKKKGGASPGEVAEKVLDEIAGAATKAVANLNLGAIKDQLGKGAGQVKDLLEKGVGGAAGGAGDAGSAVQKGAEDAGKAIKGLFGK